jgi:hypothetical protein
MNGVMRYDAMGLPPFAAGAVHVSATALSRGDPLTAVGGPGIVGGAGVTEAEGSDSAPNPEMFEAATVKVYAVPFVRPVTV